MSYDDFMGFVMKPLNEILWTKHYCAVIHQPDYFQPPHGLSDEDADNIIETIMTDKQQIEELDILVLGFTPKLLNRLMAFSVKNIASLDFSGAKPIEYKGTDKITFIEGNWLDTKNIDQKFDVIIFDEAINNVSMLQLSFFFTNMAQRAAAQPGRLRSFA